MKKILLIIILITCCTTTNAQDIDSISTMHDAIVEHQTIINDVHEISWRNPAMMESAFSHSLTHFYLNAD